MKALLLTDVEVRVLLGAVLWTADTNQNVTPQGRAILATLDRKLMAEVGEPSAPSVDHSLVPITHHAVAGGAH